MDLSIIITNYNRSKYLRNTLESVVEQSVLPKEVIVVDDCSLDDSVDVINGYCEKYPFIKLIVNDQHEGIIRSKNRGGESASGKYLYFLDSGDCLLSEFVSICDAAVKEFPGHVLLKMGSIKEVWHKDRCIFGKYDKSVGWRKCLHYHSPEDLAFIVFDDGNFLSSPIYLKEVWLYSGKFIEELGDVAEWFCNVVICARYGVVSIPEHLLVCRHYVDLTIGSKSLAGNIAIIQKIVELLDCFNFHDVISFVIHSGILFKSFSNDELMAAFMVDGELNYKMKNYYYEYLITQCNKRSACLELENQIISFVKKGGVEGCRNIALAPNNKISRRVARLLRKGDFDNVVIFDYDTADGALSYDRIKDFYFDELIVTSIIRKNKIMQEFMSRTGRDMMHSNNF